MEYFNTGTLKVTNTIQMVCDLVCVQETVYLQFFTGFLNCNPFSKDMSSSEGGVGMGMMRSYVKNLY